MRETKAILEEIKRVLSSVSEAKTKKLLNEIAKAKEINVVGHGRSWHVAKAFSMRLKHLGIDTGKNDKLSVVISGSGETKDVLKLIKKTKGKIICLTMDDDSSIAKEADLVVVLRAKKSSQPLRSLFEQSALIYLDSIIMLLMKKMKIKEKEMWRRHK